MTSDLHIYDKMLWTWVRSNCNLEQKLDEILSDFSINERVLFLDYILYRWKDNTISYMLKGWEESGDVPNSMPYLSPYKDDLSPLELLHLYLINLSEQIDKVCQNGIPARLTMIRKEIRSTAERRVALQKLNPEFSKPISEEKLLNTKEAAQFLGLTVATIYSYVHRGLLVPYKTNNKNSLFTKEQLNNLFKQNN